MGGLELTFVILVCAVLIGAPAAFMYLFTQIKQLRNELDDLRVERTDLLIGRERSKMYIESVMDTKARLEADVKELRTVVRTINTEKLRCRESYDQFVRVVRQKLQERNQTLGVEIDPLRDECDRYAYMMIERRND